MAKIWLYFYLFLNWRYFCANMSGLYRKSIIHYHVHHSMVDHCIWCNDDFNIWTRKWPPLHFTLYFLIGWSGVLYLPDLYQHNQPLLWMILAGGLVYTIGMIPFAKKGNGTHFLWHLFVLGGAFLHWLGIYLFIY